MSDTWAKLVEKPTKNVKPKNKLSTMVEIVLEVPTDSCTHHPIKDEDLKLKQCRHDGLESVAAAGEPCKLGMLQS